MGKQWKQRFYFLGFHITADGDCSHEIKKCLLLGRKAMTNLDSILKSGDITLPTKVRLVKAMFFSTSHVWMWQLDYKESWVPKNWCFWTLVLESTVESHGLFQNSWDIFKIPEICRWADDATIRAESHDTKKLFLFGRKAITNLDSILKSRDTTLLMKVHIVKAMVFPVSCMDHKKA